MQERSAGGKDRFSLFVEFTFTFKPFISFFFFKLSVIVIALQFSLEYYDLMFAAEACSQLNMLVLSSQTSFHLKSVAASYCITFNTGVKVNFVFPTIFFIFFNNIFKKLKKNKTNTDTRKHKKITQGASKYSCFHKKKINPCMSQKCNKLAPLLNSAFVTLHGL